MSAKGKKTKKRKNKNRGKLDLVFDPVGRIVDRLTTLDAFANMRPVEMKKMLFAVLVLVLAGLYFLLVKEDRYKAFKLTIFILVGFLLLNLVFDLLLPATRKPKKRAK